MLTYRKGAMKAAIEAEIVAGRGSALANKPPKVMAGNVRELSEKLLERSLRVLEDDLSHDEPRVRIDAARAIGAIGVTLLKQDSEPEPIMTPEERAARMAAAEASPEVRAYLVARGWKEPETNG
jgi:hypothetical protein